MRLQQLQRASSSPFSQSTITTGVLLLLLVAAILPQRGENFLPRPFDLQLSVSHLPKFDASTHSRSRQSSAAAPLQRARLCPTTTAPAAAPANTTTDRKSIWTKSTAAAAAADGFVLLHILVLIVSFGIDTACPLAKHQARLRVRPWYGTEQTRKRKTHCPRRIYISHHEKQQASSPTSGPTRGSTLPRSWRRNGANSYIC